MQPQKASSCSCTECPNDVTRPYVGSSAQPAALTLHRKEEKSLLLGRGPTFTCVPAPLLMAWERIFFSFFTRSPVIAAAMHIVEYIPNLQAFWSF